MDISITARNFKVDERVKKYVAKRLQKISKLYKRIYRCEVILDAEKERRNVEILLYLKRTQIIAKETSPDIFASIDLASDKVQKQLRRLKDKVSSRRNRKTKQTIAKFMNSMPGQRPLENLIEIENEMDENIIKTDSFVDRPMLPNEAKVELEISGRDFIMFKNSDTGESNVLYKRTDGCFGLIEPSF